MISVARATARPHASAHRRAPAADWGRRAGATKRGSALAGCHHADVTEAVDLGEGGPMAERAAMKAIGPGHVWLPGRAESCRRSQYPRSEITKCS